MENVSNRKIGGKKLFYTTRNLSKRILLSKTVLNDFKSAESITM